jgi:hypothetical protein
MSPQADYVVANGTGAAVRSDINGQLAAIVSQNSGATAPATTYAYMTWADTTAGVYKMRNGANNAWISLYQLDGEWSTIAFENGSAAAPSIYFKDSGTDTGVYSPGTDQVAISTGGTGRLFVDASGRVGVGASSPDANLTIGGLTNTGGQSVDAINVNRTDGVRLFGVKWDVTSNEVRFSGNTKNYVFCNGSSEAETARIDSSGRVGIGTTSPGAALHVVNATSKDQLRLGTAASEHYQIGRDTSSGYLWFYGSQTGYTGYVFDGVNGERARIDSSGRLLVGTSSGRNIGGANNRSFQIESNNGASITRNSNDSDGGTLCFAKSRGTSAGGITVVQNGDILGVIFFAGADGTDLETIGAAITAEVDGTPGSNDLPTRLVFSTTADGASSPTERMRINATGQLLFGKTTDTGATAGVVLSPSGSGEFVTSGAVVGRFNRNSSDGTIIEFRQDDVTEGSISVSGTTVSYNGAHLSRWSQLPGGATREEILRGTVLSNIDEMCGWGEEDNEQLNRMKVSDVEGDPNVSGVFQAWDDDDDTYTDDFYCAMTGDFIIRIAEGVTVQRGDLLMSAGDGTAKPQDNDIIRSKTVAKVTSTHVTCTYDDGSYCVPCVLMAC